MQHGEKVEDSGDAEHVGRRTAVVGNWQLGHWGKGRQHGVIAGVREGSGCDLGPLGWPVVLGSWMCCTWQVSD